MIVYTGMIKIDVYGYKRRFTRGVETAKSASSYCIFPYDENQLSMYWTNKSKQLSTSFPVYCHKMVLKQ